MAENLDDGEFWLPYQFLNDEDNDTPMKENNNNLTAFSTKNDDDLKALFPCEFPYEVSSPVESVVGSGETESADAEDHMAELTRQLTHQLDLNRTQNHKGMFFTGLPRSPNQLSAQNATWHLLQAAVGEVEKTRLLDPLRQQPSPLSQTNSRVGIDAQHHSLSHQQQLQSAEYQKLMMEQQMAKQKEGWMWGGNTTTTTTTLSNLSKVGATMDLSHSAWPPKQYGCGTRGVSHGNPSSVKRKSTGTGVFFPRNVADCSEKSRKKKPACSTLLVPTKVVQAKDLKKQNQTRFNDALNMDYASAFPKLQSNYGISQQKRNTSRSYK